MNHRLAACCVPLFLLAAGSSSWGLPLPKEGLLVSKEKADEVRRKVGALENHEVLSGKRGIRTVADQAVAEWPKVKAEVQGHVGQMLDLLDEGNPKGVVPDDARRAAARLSRMFDALAKLGFMYFLTGHRQYADTAYEILEMAGRVPRWGWFNWDGANMPQIHYGQYTRTAAFCLDFCWNGEATVPPQPARPLRQAVSQGPGPPLGDHGAQADRAVVRVGPAAGIDVKLRGRRREGRHQKEHRHGQNANGGLVHRATVLPKCRG